MIVGGFRGDGFLCGKQLLTSCASWCTRRDIAALDMMFLPRQIRDSELELCAQQAECDIHCLSFESCYAYFFSSGPGMPMTCGLKHLLLRVSVL